MKRQTVGVELIRERGVMKRMQKQPGVIVPFALADCEITVWLADDAGPFEADWEAPDVLDEIPVIGVCGGRKVCLDPCAGLFLR